MPLLSIYTSLVIIARPIVTFRQTTDLVSGHPSHKSSAKIYLFNPNNSNLVRQGLGGRLGVRGFHLVLAHGGDAHSFPDKVFFILRIIYHFQRQNISQELAQSCGMSYHC